MPDVTDLFRQRPCHGNYRRAERGLGQIRFMPLRRHLATAPPLWLERPSPPSEASAFNRIRAFSSFCAGWFPLWIRAVRCSRSSLLSVTTYFFTAISFLVINP